MTGTMVKSGLAALVATAVVAAWTTAPAGAQQPLPGAAPPQQKAAAAKPQGKQAAPAQPKAEPADPAHAGSRAEAQLRQRVEQLEEQLVDLQVVIGTLESLARGAGTASSSATFRAPGNGAAASGADQARMGGIETQIRALTAQVEQLTDQLRGRAGTGAYAASLPPRAEAQPAAPAAPRGPAAVAGGGFGSTTVTPGGADPIGKVLSEEPAQPPRQVAVAAPAADGANSKQLYETAYGYLLQQNYGAAEASFDDFLQRYPGDALAGNAQYWHGESHFVRGNYKAAASSFLKGYQTYARSAKAPDSLLKLAMSLDRLGQKEAACSSFNELNVKFPQAPAHVKTRADSERRRLGCA